jgi:anti-sigma B factor antagonist
MMKLTSRITQNLNVTVLELNGRFDAVEGQQIKTWFDQLNRVTPKQIVVNLSEVIFIDSTALAVLVQGLKYCRQLDGDLFLCGLQSQVEIVFELTRLDKAFRIFDNQVEAVAAFGKLEE